MLSERLNYSALHSLRHGGHAYFSPNPAVNFLRNPMLAAGGNPITPSVYSHHPNIFMSAQQASTLYRLPGLSFSSQTHPTIAGLIGHNSNSAAAFAAAAAAATAAVAATNYQQSVMRDSKPFDNNSEEKIEDKKTATKEEKEKVEV